MTNYVIFGPLRNSCHIRIQTSGSIFV